MKLMTPAEVAEMLSVNVDTVKRYSRSGELVGLQLGGRWRYQLSDIEEFIERQKAKSKSAAQSSTPTTNEELSAINPEKENSPKMDSPMLKQLLSKNQSLSSQLIPQEEPPELGSNLFGEVIVDVIPEADPIDLMLKLKADGMAYPAIAEHLNKLGLKTKHGKEWSKATIENNIRKHKKEMEDILQ